MMSTQVLNNSPNLDADRVVGDPYVQASYEQILQGRVVEGMSDLLPALQSRRLLSTQAEWTAFVQECRNHPLRSLLHQDPFTFRAYTKPRGYAGDAVLLDFIYGVEEGWGPPADTTELGRQIFEFTTHSSACDAVRARRGFIADLLDNFAEETPRPHVLSVAAGHLREAELAACVRRRKLGRYVALDSDVESLNEIDRCYRRHGVEAVRGRVGHLITGRADLGRFDLIYSTGLFDYLSQAAAQALVNTLFRLLRPRGRLIVANFLPGILDVGYMETYMAWELIYRNRQEMIALLHNVPQAEIREIKIFAEDNQNIIFLEVTHK